MLLLLANKMQAFVDLPHYVNVNDSGGLTTRPWRHVPPAPNFWAKKSAPHSRIGPDLLSKVLICTKFGDLIIRKIIKIVATRCQILRLKCTKFDFGWGSAPDPTGGAYSAPQTP